MRPETGEQEVPMRAVEMGHKDEANAQLVPALQILPYMHDLRRTQTFRIFWTGVFYMHAVQLHATMYSMQGTSGAG